MVQNTKTKAQEELLSYSLLDNDIYEYIKNKIEVYYFTNVNTRIVFEEIPRMFEEELDIREFLYDLIDKKLIEKDFVEIILDLIKKINVNYKIIDELISTLEKNYLQNEKNKILENIGKLQGEENKNLLLEALKDLKSINLKLNELKGEGNNER